MQSVSEPSPNERLWSWRDVAEYLGVSRSWVYQKADAGEIPSLRFAGCLRFDPALIKAYARGEWKPPKAGSVLQLRSIR